MMPLLTELDSFTLTLWHSGYRSSGREFRSI